MQFNNVYTRPMPDFEKKPAVVKLNTAAIVREEALIQKQQIKEEQVMKEFEMNLRDDSEYNRWLEENREKTEVETMEHRQKKKIEMELC